MQLSQTRQQSWEIQRPLLASTRLPPQQLPARLCRLLKSLNRHWGGRKSKCISSPSKELASLSTPWPQALHLTLTDQERRMGLLLPVLAGGTREKGWKDVWFWWHPLYIQEETVRNFNQEEEKSDSVLIYFRLGFVFNFSFFFPFLCTFTNNTTARDKILFRYTALLPHLSHCRISQSSLQGHKSHLKPQKTLQWQKDASSRVSIRKMRHPEDATLSTLPWA